MTLPFSRRRFLAVSAAAVAAGPALAGATEIAEWHGRALGAAAQVKLSGVDAAAAQSLFVDLQKELVRLEDVFSLYRDGSELSRLNRDGVLEGPAPELLELLSLSDTLYRGTGGAFDPTVQPVWQMQAAHLLEGKTPAPESLARTMAHVGWDGVAFDSREVRFARPDMALTLNGIAQGYVTDRIAAFLEARGFTDVLVDIGEIVGRGTRPDGRPWHVGVITPEGRIVRRLELKGRALATSAPLGTVLDPDGRVGHILNPATGKPAMAVQLVSISAATAALADGLSTACCAANTREALEMIVARFGDARIETVL